MQVSTSGHTYYAYANLSGLDYQATYSFTVTAEDELETVTSRATGVKSTPIFHWGENDVVFEVPTTFNSDTRMKGNLLLKGDGNFGNYLRFGDGDYCYLAELSDDKLTIKASAINLDTSNLTQKGKSINFAESGTWTPLFSISGVTYTAQEGWYSKSGNIVTVGFYLKAACRSGYTDDLVVIDGLPFTPASAAAGGGMCSGALMSAGFNFQCFVAEKDAYDCPVITTRVQACDRESSGNLSTSASGCWYPSNAILTVSGTITFMTN
jgi:hypothetical protein